MYAEIIDVIINEPTNDEKKLKLIAELEAIEENPSEATREFIAQTKAAAEFTYFRSKFEEIIAKIDRLHNKLSELEEAAAAVSNKVVCPACKKVNSADAEFCSHCGLDLTDDE